MSMKRTITGTKADVVAHLNEHLAYLIGRRDDLTLPKNRRDYYAGQVEGLRFAISVLDDWET